MHTIVRSEAFSDTTFLWEVMAPGGGSYGTPGCVNAALRAVVERDLNQELAAEEREHVALLTTEHQRWKAGKAGIL